MNCTHTHSSEGSTTWTYIPFTFLLSSLVFSCWLSRMISKTFSLPPIFFLWYLPCRLVIMWPSTWTKGASPPNLPKGYWNWPTGSKISLALTLASNPCRSLLCSCCKQYATVPVVLSMLYLLVFSWPALSLNGAPPPGLPSWKAKPPPSSCQERNVLFLFQASLVLYFPFVFTQKRRCIIASANERVREAWEQHCWDDVSLWKLPELIHAMFAYNQTLVLFTASPFYSLWMTKDRLVLHVTIA